MNLLEKPTNSPSSGGARTLAWVMTVSFLTTGALLLGWDQIEHIYLTDASSVYLHRMHIIRGISTGVLVSVGIAWLILRNRRRYENRMMALQQELIRKERLAAIGELARGVAHEIRNPLAGIGGALTMLAREIPPDDDTQEMMDEVQKQVHRMEHLVQDLLAYARPGPVHPEWTNLHSILKQAATSISQLPATPEADLVMALDPLLPEIYTEPRELEHALENLLMNAFQAVAEGGKIEVRTWRNRDGVHISISDDGAGMDADVRDKIFEPFFTTKARGTGLGLSLVRRAVDSCGGKISVESTPGRGTTFDLTLPTKRAPERESIKGLEPTSR
jgi:signal transduction histidine kinase